MTNEELDEVRRLMVAYDDLETWCLNLTELSRRLLRGCRGDERVEEPAAASIAAEVDQTVRYLESNRLAVDKIRTRIGLLPPKTR